MQLRVLGPLLVSDRPVGSPLTRRLLATLALHRNSAVGVATLIESVWPDEDGRRRPKDPKATLQAMVSRLRAELAPLAVERRGEAYVLVCPPGSCDADVVVAFGSRSSPNGDGAGSTPTVGDLDRVLALFRGVPWADLPDDLDAVADAQRLDRLARELRVDRLVALVAERSADRALAEADVCIAVDPFDERPWRIRMTVLAGTGRLREALHTAETHRVMLRDEAGLDPDSETLRLVESLRSSSGVGSLLTSCDSDARSDNGTGFELPTVDFDLFAAPARDLSRPWDGPLGAHPALVSRARAIRLITEGVGVAGSVGSARAILICGPRGVGRSRLLEELRPRLTRSGFAVASFDCIPGVDLPLAAVAGLAGQLDPGSTLGSPAGGQPSPDRSHGVEDAVDAAAHMTAVIDGATRLSSLIESVPTVLLVDDLHLADQASVDALMLVVMRARPDQQVVLVATVATGTGAPPDPNFEHLVGSMHATVIDLSPLDEPAVTLMVAEMCGTPPGATLARTVTLASGGLPSEVIAVLRRLLAGRHLVSVGRFVNLDTLGDSSLDGALGAASDLTDRVWSDGDPDGEVLAAAAVLAVSPRINDLAKALGWTRGRCLAALAMAERDALIVIGRGRLRFLDPRLRAGLLGSLTTARRDELRSAFVRRLTSSAGELDAERRLLVADHAVGVLEPGERSEVVLECIVDASRSAAAGGDWLRAAEFLGAVIDNTTDPQRVRALHHAVGMAHFRGHDRLGALHHLRLALELAESGARVNTVGSSAEARVDTAAEVGRALIDLHRADLSLLVPGEPLPATGSLEGWLRGNSASHPELAAEMLALLAEQAMGEWRLADGEDLAAEAVRNCRAFDDPGVHARAWFAWGLVAYARNDPGPARERFRRSHRAAEAARDPWVGAWAATREGLSDLARGGDPKDMEVRFQRLLPSLNAMRHFSEQTLAVTALSHLAGMRGALGELEEHVEAGFELMGRSGYLFAEPALMNLRLHLLMAQGESGRAAALLSEWSSGGRQLRAMWGALFDTLDDTAEVDSGSVLARIPRPLPDLIDLSRAPVVVLGGRLAVASRSVGWGRWALDGARSLHAQGVDQVLGVPQSVSALLGRLENEFA